jgi:hypothetical protein
MAVAAVTLAGLLVACPAAVAADRLIRARRRRRMSFRTADAVARPSRIGGYV